MNTDFYDVRITEGTLTTIMVDNGKVEEISSSFNKGAAVRALVGGSWGFVSTDDITKIDKAIEDASTLAHKMNAKKPRDKVILAECGTENISEVTEVLKDPQNIPIEDKVSLLMDIEERMKLPRIQSTSIMYLQGSAVSRYYNSEGLECDRSTTHCGCALTAVAKDDGVYQASRESRFGVKGFELFDENDFFKLAEHAASTADALLDASAPKGGTMPVILDPELAGVFIHEAVGHASEADIVLEGGSCLEGKIGEKIASSDLRVIDDPTFKGYGYYTFDSEGSKAKKTTI
ncbi:MAG: TldD/PmbA family protein, partial [Methanosarcinales archaeon]|nr:TldD/PmbA family protein [Methanosarcinales archaeon]